MGIGFAKMLFEFPITQHNELVMQNIRNVAIEQVNRNKQVYASVHGSRAQNLNALAQLRKNPNAFVGFIRTTYKAIIDKLALYIAPIICIILIIFYIAYLKKKKKKNSSDTSKGIISDNTYNMPKSSSWQINQFMSALNPLGSTGATVPRNLIPGRCDMTKWIPNASDKSKCDATQRPKDIIWSLDLSKMGSDYSNLPDKIKNNNSKYRNILIPYDKSPEASFYVPQCDKAVYYDTCTDVNDLSTCQPAPLFDDLGLSCALKKQKSQSYTNTSICNSNTSKDNGLTSKDNGLTSTGKSNYCKNKNKSNKNL